MQVILILHQQLRMLYINRDYVGGGLLYAGGFPPPSNFNPSCKEQTPKHHTDMLRVLNTKFVNNSATHGAGVYISMLNTNHPVTPFVIAIENCSFVDNHGSLGSAIFIRQENNAAVDYFTFVLWIIVKNCIFAKNSYPSCLPRFL